MAVAFLGQHFGRDFLRWPLGFLQRHDRRPVELVLRMAERGINSPLTSSCGRLFDAVAALIGVRHQVNYEAQAAIELEMAIAGCSQDESGYPFELLRERDPWTIGTRPLFEALLGDLRARAGPATMSQRFHNGLVEQFAKIARLLRQSEQLNRVCLSGGTFQNLYLLERLTRRLRAEGFEVFTHSEVPASDGGLSLGQALVAAHRLRA